MAFSYGVPITFSLPVSGADEYDGALDDIISACVQVLSQRVTVDGLDINGDLDIQGNVVINIGGLLFSPLTAGTGPDNNTAYVSSLGELHFVDGEGNDVQLTLNGAIDISGLAGGIGGNYANAGAHLNYNSSTNTYTHTDGSGNASNIQGASLELSAGTATNKTTLNPNASGPSISFAFPNSYPGVTNVPLVSDTTGTMRFSQDIQVNTITGSQVTVLGAVQASGFMRCSGSMTTAGTVTAAQTGSFSVFHTAREILHDNTFRLLFSSTEMESTKSTVTLGVFSGATGPTYQIGGTGTGVLYCAIRGLKVGDVINNFGVRLLSRASNQTVFTLFQGNTDGSKTPLSLGLEASGAAIQTLSAFALGVTALADCHYFIQVDCNTVASGDDLVLSAWLDYSRTAGSAGI